MSDSRVVNDFNDDAAAFAKNYLQTYYAGEPDPDEQIVLKFCVEQFSRLKTSDVLLDVGCGPTVHHILPAEPYVREIHVADYLPECLNEIQKWQNRDPQAHDWNAFTRFALEAEGSRPTREAIRQREDAVRKKITQIGPCDLRRRPPLESMSGYKAVSCFYATEQACMVQDDWSLHQRREAWRDVMGNLVSLLKRGGDGLLFVSCVRRSDHYLTYDAKTGQPHRASVAPD